MKRSDGNITIIKSTIDHYRDNFYWRLQDQLSGNLNIIVGANQFETSVKTRISFPHTLTANHYFMNRSLLIQPYAIASGVKADTLVIELNPRIISNWIILLLRRIIGRKTNVWGHFDSRKRESTFRTNLKRCMAHLSGGVVFSYTNRDKQRFELQWGLSNVHSLNNALYPYKDIYFLNSENISDFIYCGRLSKDKNVIHIIKSFSLALTYLGKDCKLKIVGDGPLKSDLEQIASDLSINESVSFLGQVNDVDLLRLEYATCIASISADFVGLQAVQTLGFGVPLIYPRNPINFRHAPEAQLLNKHNSIEFGEDASDLANAILLAYRNVGYWVEKRRLISSEISHQHNIENMVKNFISGIDASTQLN